MVLIKKNYIKFILTLFMGILIGIIIGAILINSLISYRIDKYHEEIEYLKSTIDNKDIKLKKLEASINKWRLVLKDIKSNLEYKEGELSEIDAIELNKEICSKYGILLGKDVKKLDIQMIEGIIDNRIMKLNNKEYKLRVTKIILTDVLDIWVEVKALD